MGTPEFEIVNSANEATGSDKGRHESTAHVVFRRISGRFYDRARLCYTPHCSDHGAMNRVSREEDFWRCTVCHLGGIWHRPPLRYFDPKPGAWYTKKGLAAARKPKPPRDIAAEAQVLIAQSWDLHCWWRSRRDDELIRLVTEAMQYERDR